LNRSSRLVVAEPARILAFAFLVALAFALLGASQAHAATALAWGDNDRGALGVGSEEEEIATPTPVVGLSNLTQISSSNDSTLGLLADGSVFGWGDNRSAALGVTSFFPGNFKNAPLSVPGVSGAVAVAAGRHAYFALRADGTVLAWGRDNLAQLGNGPDGRAGRDEPGDCDGINGFCRISPAQVPGATDVISIAAGEDFVLALRSDGTVLAWGDDQFGQTATPPSLEEERHPTSDNGPCFCTPNPVTVPGVSGAVAIAAGDNSAFALRADGTVVGWGRNDAGQIGTGIASPESGCECLPPTPVAGLSGADMLSARSFGGIARSGAGLQAWPQFVASESEEGESALVPQPITIGGTAGVLAVSGDNELALQPDGTVSRFVGQEDFAPAAVPVVSAETILGISGASGVAGAGRSDFALIGPTRAIHVAVTGSGSGTVGGAPGVLCPGSCENGFVEGSDQYLLANSTAGGFAGFAGACTGTAACHLKLGFDQSVTATFGTPTGTTITGSNIDTKGGTAAFTYSAPGAITGYQCKLERPLPIPAPVPHRKIKHKKHHRKTHHKKHGKAGASAAKAKHKPKPKPKPKPPVTTPLPRIPAEFVDCSASGTSFANLTPGNYSFSVRALDSLGADAHPAVQSFVVQAPATTKKKPRKKHHKEHHPGKGKHQA
jgi:hypothetical protein